MEEMTSPQSGVYDLAPEERRELALSLLNRSDRAKVARGAFRQAYPNAPEEMIHTAVHHLYVDGPVAAVDWLAEAELFLRDPAQEIGYGPTLHLLDHAYNWLQFQALLPEGKAELLALVRQLKEFADDGDMEAVRETVAELESTLEGNRSAPDFL